MRVNGRLTWIALLLAAGCVLAADPEPAVVLGVNFCDWQDRFGTEESLRAMHYLQKMGMRDIVFTPTWYQKTYASTTIHRLPAKTPGDQRLMTDLRRAVKLGFRVGLKHHIDPEDRIPRSNIAFDSRRDFELWWKNYRDLTLHYARMAKLNNIQDFSVGCELSGVSVHPYTSYWVALIKELRQMFGENGPRITYSARHQNVANIAFLDELDYIGINAWPYFHEGGTVTVASIGQSWRRSIYFPEAFQTSRKFERRPGEEGQDLDFFDYIRLVSRLYKKPVVLTEFGCQSKQGILTKPVDWWLPGNPDVLAQAMYFEGFFQELLADIKTFGETNPGEPYPLQSILIWNYLPNEGGPRNTDYTFRNKPLTEKVIAEFLNQIPPRPSPKKAEK